MLEGEFQPQEEVAGEVGMDHRPPIKRVGENKQSRGWGENKQSKEWGKIKIKRVGENEQSREWGKIN